MIIVIQKPEIWMLLSWRLRIWLNMFLTRIFSSFFFMFEPDSGSIVLEPPQLPSRGSRRGRRIVWTRRPGAWWSWPRARAPCGSSLKPSHRRGCHGPYSQRLDDWMTVAEKLPWFVGFHHGTSWHYISSPPLFRTCFFRSGARLLVWEPRKGWRWLNADIRTFWWLWLQRSFELSFLLWNQTLLTWQWKSPINQLFTDFFLVYANWNRRFPMAMADSQKVTTIARAWWRKDIVPWFAATTPWEVLVNAKNHCDPCEQ